MIRVLMKISFRKIIREKGRSSCVILAVFFTIVLFTTVFSTLFFVADAAEEMIRATSPILADAIFTVSENEYEKICQNKRVEEASMGIRLAIMREPSGIGGIQMFDFEDEMARWMRYYPTKGRMPEKGNEIVVSDQYLKECGDDTKLQTELTYYIGDEEYTDTFTIVGTYEMSGQPLHVVLTSDDFYREVSERLVKKGINPEEATYMMTGVMFSSRGNVRRLVSMLISEEGIDLEEGEVFLNDTSLLESMGIGVWAAIFGLLLFVMIVGYLFISNVFQISALKEVRFYGKLSTNGVTKKEIKRIVRWGNNILFCISVVPALAAGYVFSALILPGILSANTVLQIERSGNAMIFVLSLTFSYLTVRVSERKAVQMAKNVSPIEMKKYSGNFGRVKAADNKECMKKFAVRHFKSDKIKALKVCVSVALSLMLACAFYAVAEGFDEEEYAKKELDADFIVAKEPVFTNPNLNPVSYARTSQEEVADYRVFPGIKAEGASALSLVNIHLPDAGLERLIRIKGKEYVDTYMDTPGEAWVDIYGLDEMLLRKLNPIRGEIDWELFSTGNYVLLNPVYGDDNEDNEACYEPGDEVTIHFRSGEEGTYTVMAIVERLPVSLAFPTTSWEGDMYLPMAEWQEMEKQTDYYLYAFDVEEGHHKLWNDVLENGIGRAKELSGSRLAYRSAQTAAKEAKEYTDGLKLAGFVLSIILLAMGILNFINCTVSSIYSRSKEFAILRSMGMEEQEIEASLAKEGMLYMAGGFVPGALLTVPGVYILIDKVLTESYITYHFYPLIYALFALLGCAAAVMVPLIAYKMMDRKGNFLERIRHS